MLGSSFVFFIGYTLYLAPYVALFPEVAKHKDDRIHTVIFQSVSGSGGSTVAIFLPLFLVSSAIGKEVSDSNLPNLQEIRYPSPIANEIQNNFLFFMVIIFFYSLLF